LLWCEWCRFPAEVWNHLRLTPTLALLRGIDVYPTAAAGIINTWTYGPLPLLALSPAALGGSPLGALTLGGLGNFGWTVAAILWVCRRWPVEQRTRNPWSITLIAAALSIALFPEAAWRVIYADNTAVALGLVANLLLLRGPKSSQRWWAALAAMAPLACKQTGLGVVVAQLIWLGVSEGRKVWLTQLGRCIAAGAILGLAGIAWFGFPGLWFILIDLPRGFLAVDDPWSRMAVFAAPLSLHLGLPLITIAVLGRRAWQSGSPLLLLSLTWLASVPLGIMGFFQMGGGINSLQAFELWLPGMAVWGLTHAHRRRPRLVLPLSGLVAGVLALVRIASIPSPSLQPQFASVATATAIAESLPGQVWFPLNPLVTLYADGRLYHDEDGLYVRAAAGQPATWDQLPAHLPPQWSGVVMRTGALSWGVAENLIPEAAVAYEVDGWTVWRWPAGSPVTP